MNRDAIIASLLQQRYSTDDSRTRQAACLLLDLFREASAGESLADAFETLAASVPEETAAALESMARTVGFDVGRPAARGGGDGANP